MYVCITEVLKSNLCDYDKCIYLSKGHNGTQVASTNFWSFSCFLFPVVFQQKIC